MDGALTIGSGLLGLLMLLWLRLRRRRAGHPAGDAAGRSRTLPLPPGLALKPQPLLSPPEAALYNLLKLTVQDDFLIFAQVPLWCLFDLQTDDRRQRTAFLNQVALKRVDFALVHPGSLTVTKIVELDDADGADGRRQARRQLLEQICRKAGIELIRLDGGASYTVPQLAAALGLAAEE